MFVIILIIYQHILVAYDWIYLCLYSWILTMKSLMHLVISPPMKSVTGEIALITGAGHGIGRELGLQLARLGAKIICLDINEANNKQTVTDICREGGIAWGYRCDVSKYNDVRAVCNKIKREVGQVTILINNAGIMPCKPFMKHTPQDVEKIFQVNVYSHFWMVMEWLPSFIESKKGHIVALSSITGLLATSNLVPCGSSKFAIRGLMEGLSEEMRYAGRNPEIKFTCVHPFVVNTGLAKNPRIRFPSFNPITTPEQCAADIIKGIRREEEMVCIPPKDFYGHKIMSMMPNGARKAFLDFMDTGVDEHET